MTYQSPLDLQQYLSTLEKGNFLTNWNTDNMQTRNYIMSKAISCQERQALRFKHRPAHYYAQETI